MKLKAQQEGGLIKILEGCEKAGVAQFSNNLLILF
jgi:hypothetical protein